MKIRFVDREHRDFYTRMLAKTRNSDSYHRAFFFTVGICPETRNSVNRLFNFKENGIRPEGLDEAWQTGGTRRLCRLAFNLWNGWTQDGAENLSAPYELFDCGFAPYFMEAIKLRYPEYCHELAYSRERASGPAR